MNNLAKKQIEWIRWMHSQYPSNYMIGEHKANSSMQKEIEETFPEAFVEPERERITLIIEYDKSENQFIGICKWVENSLLHVYKNLKVSLSPKAEKQSGVSE